MVGGSNGTLPLPLIEPCLLCFATPERSIIHPCNCCDFKKTRPELGFKITTRALKVREDEAPLVESGDGEAPGRGHAEAEGEGKGGQDRGRASRRFPISSCPRRLPTADRKAGVHHAYWRRRCEISVMSCCCVMLAWLMKTMTAVGVSHACFFSPVFFRFCVFTQELCALWSLCVHRAFCRMVVRKVYTPRQASKHHNDQVCGRAR